MAPKLPWTPWHGVVKLREDRAHRQALSLADFAADLHDVMMQKGARPIYEDPARVFRADLPDLLPAGSSRRTSSSGWPARTPRRSVQLELTYGGGKTHTLITLLHLVHDPASFPTCPRSRSSSSTSAPHCRDAGRRPQLRQARRREGHGGARARRRATLAEASLERAGIPDRRRRRAARPPRRRASTPSGKRRPQNPAGRSAVEPASRRTSRRWS